MPKFKKMKSEKSDLYTLVDRDRVGNEKPYNSSSKMSPEYLFDIIIIEQFYHIITLNRERQLKEAIEREEFGIEKAIQMGLLPEDVSKSNHCLHETMRKKIKACEFYFLSEEQKKQKLHWMGVLFSDEVDEAKKKLINNNEQGLIKYYSYFSDFLLPGRWFNIDIMLLSQPNIVKKMLLEFCIKTDAKINNMQLKRDFEYIKNNKIDEVVLLENIRQAMKYKTGSDGKRYMWKALYLKEGINV